MLKELREIGADAACIDARTRAQAGFSGPQRNVVADYLQRIDAASAAGFGEVLSDFLASALDGAVADPELYEEGARHG
jgi:hypothetical protein